MVAETFVTIFWYPASHIMLAQRCAKERESVIWGSKFPPQSNTVTSKEGTNSTMGISHFEISPKYL